LLRSIHQIFTISFYLFFSSAVLAQNSLQTTLERLGINQALYLPEDILSTKSIVLYSVPEGNNDSKWTNKLDELQSFFAEVGIDAVAYINQDELLPLPNQLLSVPDYLKKRRIEHLILVLISAEDQPIFFAIGNYNERETWWDEGSNFWVRNPIEWEPMFEEVSNFLKTAAYKRTNLLVNDQPEYFVPEVANNFIFSSSVPRSKGSEVQVALRPVDLAFYEGLGPQIFSGEALAGSLNYQQTFISQAEYLNAFAMDSLNNVELIDGKSTKRQLTRSGYDYELEYISGDFDLLNRYFKSTKERQPFDGERTVFYLRDLRRNQIYYGKEWNPLANWYQAFEHFIDTFSSVLMLEDD
jgi:hypothetical protein